MSRKNNGPDLTMLALAAYDAIRRNMEENDGEERSGAGTRCGSSCSVW